MNRTFHICKISLLLIFATVELRGGNTAPPAELSLKEVVELAIMQSPSAMNILHQRENAYWRYRNFQTSRRPQLSLDGTLPDYISSNTPVTQPDGSVEFHNVKLSKSSLRLTLNQEIALSGTRIFAGADAMRIDNLEDKSVAYSGSPFLIGFNQPLFAFNEARWTKKIEPLIWEESKRFYNEAIETISQRATNLFFSYMQVCSSFDLAESNLKNSRQNLSIAEVKIKLGRISMNEFNRVRLAMANAQKALSSATMQLENAEFDLKSFIGFEQAQNISLKLPDAVPELSIDVVKALEYAMMNRKEVPQFQRQLLQAEKEHKKAKRSNGLTSYLEGSYGLTSSNTKLGGLLDQPETLKTLKLSFNIPVMDWGRLASRVKMANSNLDLTRYEVEKSRQQFEREVVVQAGQFKVLYDQIASSQEADQVAEAGYNIALKKYQNGNLSITDLNIALQERDQSRRDYILALSQFWDAYYNIRRLTLYDFESGQTLVNEQDLMTKP
ncbi:MAG: TolC family protein [Carboxylicivirga sp.]|nr:TolC family protein [Carboxylicivirga sp.]